MGDTDLGKDNDVPVEARPVETDEPSDLMTALVAGVNAAANTGESLAAKLDVLSNGVARAHRRRSGVIFAAGIVAVLVLLQGGVYLLGERTDRAVEKEARQERRVLFECSSPSTSTDRHECFEQREEASSARTGRAAIAVAMCFADKVPDVQRCVEQSIAANPPVIDPNNIP